MAKYGGSPKNRYIREWYGNHFHELLPDRLTDDLGFMIQVAENVDWPLASGSNAVTRNLDVIVKSLSHFKESAKSYRETKEGEDRFEWQDWTDSVYSKVIQKLFNHLAFRAFLDQCSESIITDNPCQLLNQGPETSIELMKRIAEYAEIPIGREFEFYREAYGHVKEAFSSMCAG